MENYSLPLKNGKPNGTLASNSHYFTPKSTKGPLVAVGGRAHNRDSRRVTSGNAHIATALPSSQSSTGPRKDVHRATKKQKRDPGTVSARVVPESTAGKRTPAPQNGKRGPGRPRKVQTITASISKVLQSAAALGKNENAIAFRCFDPLEHLTGAERVGIIGLPGTGKSTTVKSLLYELQSTFATMLVVSGSETDNNPEHGGPKDTETPHQPTTPCDELKKQEHPHTVDT
jgi:ABC-type glutathione transport system ATPase component